MLNTKQILSLILFMVFTTSVVNAHALSHLFDDDVNSIEHCNSCDEYTLSGQDDIHFINTDSNPYALPNLEFVILSTPDNYTQAPVLIFKSGKYFNKPPPFKLV